MATGVLRPNPNRRVIPMRPWNRLAHALCGTALVLARGHGGFNAALDEIKDEAAAG